MRDRLVSVRYASRLNNFAVLGYPGSAIGDLYNTVSTVFHDWWLPQLADGSRFNGTQDCLDPDAMADQGHIPGLVCLQNLPETTCGAPLYLFERFSIAQSEQMGFMPEMPERLGKLLFDLCLQVAFPGPEMDLPKQVTIFNIKACVLKQDFRCLARTYTATAVDTGKPDVRERGRQHGGLLPSQRSQSGLGASLYPFLAVPVGLTVSYQVNS